MRAAKHDFYPRPPRGGRLRGGWTRKDTGIFLSTPSARRATKFAMLGDQSGIISIHALREEGDLPDIAAQTHYSHFYPRPPRGGRPDTTDKSKQRMEFLSTPSARRATYWCYCFFTFYRISIHALREEGDAAHSAGSRRSTNFYPRPPRGGRPAPTQRSSGTWTDFYPRPPRGGRLRQHHLHDERRKISIHALREEGDSQPNTRCGAMADFYPRPPRGGRHGKVGATTISSLFLSTPSARRATTHTVNVADAAMISIHALREEGDAHRGRSVRPGIRISIHALREEGDVTIHVPVSDCI